jgi:Domain of unknown function (DUF1918)
MQVSQTGTTMGGCKREEGIQMASSNSPLHAQPGDRLVIRGHHQGEPQRDGEVLKALGEGGGPPYLVRWEDGHEAEVFPGSDVFIQHLAKSKKTKST